MWLQIGFIQNRFMNELLCTYILSNNYTLSLSSYIRVILRTYTLFVHYIIVAILCILTNFTM